jgi:hypothetical protein
MTTKNSKNPLIGIAPFVNTIKEKEKKMEED